MNRRTIQTTYIDTKSLEILTEDEFRKLVLGDILTKDISGELVIVIPNKLPFVSWVDKEKTEEAEESGTLGYFDGIRVEIDTDFKQDAFRLLVEEESGTPESS